MLPHDLLNSEAVKTLSHSGYRLMVLFAAQYDGSNNGALGLTPGQAAKNGIRSQTTFYKVLQELEEHAILERTHEASRVPPRPTMYALTWIPVNDTEYSLAKRVPTRAYKAWTK